MTIRKPTTNTSAIQTRSIEARLAPVTTIFSLLLVLVSTLSPFNFSFDNSFSIEMIVSRFDHPSYLKDLLANVLLFLPFGFGLTGLIQNRLNGVLVLVVIVATSFSLSVSAEVLQVFLPSRSPTLTDILTNSVGGCLGFLCHFWRHSILNQSLKLLAKRRQCSLKMLVASFIGYITLAFVVTIALQNAASLSNWDLTFPLLVGNERTGERPWQGHITDISIADKALSQREIAQLFSAENSPIAAIVANYQLTDRDFRDQTGHLPNLSWQGIPLDAQNKIGVSLTGSHWLVTPTSAATLTQKIRKTSQFTLSTTVATASTTQTGPARIISLSSNPFQRNFTLGQERNQLVFRLRTPLTGDNGTNPELIIPNVFTDTNFHHLVITYNGSTLQVYVDQPQQLSSLKLSPDITLVRYLLPFGSWDTHLNILGSKVYRVLYYGIIFIPLGFLLALITSIVRGRWVFSGLLICQGIILPCLIVEAVLVNGRTMQLGNLLLSMGMMTGTLLVTKLWLLTWFPRSKVRQI